MALPVTDSDYEEAARRINAGAATAGIDGPPLSFLSLKDAVARGEIVVLAGTDCVLKAHFDAYVFTGNPTPAWWVNPVYGSATFWRTLFRELATELVARGHGDTPVRWTKSGAVAAFTKTAFKFKADSKPYYEFTANKALVVL